MSNNSQQPQPNPIAVVIATAVLNPKAVKPMLTEGIRQAAGIGLQALGIELAQVRLDPEEPQENPDKER